MCAFTGASSYVAAVCVGVCVLVCVCKGEGALLPWEQIQVDRYMLVCTSVIISCYSAKYCSGTRYNCETINL